MAPSEEATLGKWQLWVLCGKRLQTPWDPEIRHRINRVRDLFQGLVWRAHGWNFLEAWPPFTTQGLPLQTDNGERESLRERGGVFLSSVGNEELNIKATSF